MMYGGDKIFYTIAAWRVDAKKITGSSEYYWFIHYHPMFYAVAKAFSAQRHKFTKPVYHITICPPPFLFKYLRQIPVINGDPGFNSFCNTIIDNPVIIINASLVNFPSSCRQ